MLPNSDPRVGVDRTLIASLKAEFALRGFVLLVADDDRGQPLFTISRWGLTRTLRSTDEVQSFLVQIGGAG